MNTPLSQCHALLGAIQYSAAWQTHIRCTLNWTAACPQAVKRQGRSNEGWRVGWWEQAMMLGRDGAGVEEGRVEEGNEQERDLTRHGRSEGKRRGLKGTDEE